MLTSLFLQLKTSCLGCTPSSFIVVTVNRSSPKFFWLLSQKHWNINKHLGYKCYVLMNHQKQADSSPRKAWCVKIKNQKIIRGVRDRGPTSMSGSGLQKEQHWRWSNQGMYCQKEITRMKEQIKEAKGASMKTQRTKKFWLWKLWGKARVAGISSNNKKTLSE